MFWLPWKHFGHPSDVTDKFWPKLVLEIFHFESVENVRRQRTDGRTTDPCYTLYLLYTSSHFGSSETKSEHSEKDELLKLVQE